MVTTHSRECGPVHFGWFVNDILYNIERFPVHGNYNMNHVIIWDNLRAHKTPYATTIIGDCPSPNNFSSVDRPPYYPKLALIEYIFCELAVELGRRCTHDWTMVD